MRGFALTREDCEVVLAVADEMSVTRAANRLHLSQSAVSHHLKALENRIGGILFRREPRRMIPTDAGRVLAEHAQRVVEMLRCAEDAVASSM